MFTPTVKNLVLIAMLCVACQMLVSDAAAQTTGARLDEAVSTAFDVSVIYHGFASGMGMTAGAAFLGFIVVVFLKPALGRIARNIIKVTNGQPSGSE